MKLSSGVLITCLLAASCGNVSKNSSLKQETGSQNVYVRVSNSLLTQAWVQDHQFNRDHAKNSEYAIGWIPENLFNQLTHQERALITVLDEEKVTRGFLNPFTLTEEKSFDIQSDAKAGYHNYAALTEEMQNLANTYSDLAELESIGKSNQGRDLWMMRVTANIAQSHGFKPKLLYISNMHGDEVIGRELALKHLNRLLADYGKDPRITNLVDHSEIFIVPSMNPDGFEMKRRANSKGADLNRSFPDFTSDPNDSTTGRPIEVAAIMALHQKHHFISAINFHGGTVCFNLPWDTKPNNNDNTKFGDDAVIYRLGRSYADSNPEMYKNSEFDRGLTYGFEWYEVNGGMQDWSIYYRNSMHATVELSYIKWPEESQIEIAWKENKESMLAYMEQSLFGVHASVVDSSGAPVNNISVKMSSSSRVLKYTTNSFVRPSVPGVQNVVIEAEGYKPTALTTTASAFSGAFDHVVLEKK